MPDTTPPIPETAMPISAAAKERGISRQAVDKLIRAGRLQVWIDPSDKSRRRRLIDPVELDAVRGQPSTLAAPEPDDSNEGTGEELGNDRREADTKRAQYMARKLELEIAEKEGRLIDLDEVKGAHEAAAMQARQAMEALGTQIKADPALPLAMKSRIDELVAGACNKAASAFRTAAGTASRGAAVVLLAVATGIAAPVQMDAATWAEENDFIVPDGELAGNVIDWSLTPYSPNILKALETHQRVVVRKSSQTGLTTAGIAWLGSRIDLNPANALCVQGSMPKAREFSEAKLTPSFTATTVLRAKVHEDRQNSKKGSTTTVKRYGIHMLKICGGNSAADLSGGTYKYIYDDDRDQYPADLDNQGDPDTLIKARQKSFDAMGTARRLSTGTPTVKGASRTDRDFMAGDQRYMHVKCPHCGAAQKLTFDRLDYDEGPEPRARMKCIKGCTIEHHDKPAMIREACAANDGHGRWVAENPGGRYPSYHVDALHSLLETWDTVVLDYQDAKGDSLQMQAFYNTTLGLPYEETGEGLAAPKLHEARGPHNVGELPDGLLAVTAAVDVQGNRLEYGCYGWGPSSVAGVPDGALIDKGVLEGDPREAKVWNALDHVLARTYENGTHRSGIDLAGVDTGFLTNRVYRYAIGRHDVKAVDGRGDPLMTPNGTPKNKPVFNQAGRAIGSIMLHPVGSYGLKSEVLSALGRTVGDDVKPGAVRYPMDCDLAYFEQLTAETLVTRTNRSTRQASQIWKKKEGQPNEALDIAVYARAMAHLIGVFRFTPEQWKALFVDRAKLPDHELPGLEALWLGMAPKKEADNLAAKPSRKSRVMEAIRRHNERIKGDLS